MPELSLPVALFIGTIAPLPDSGRPTGMFKFPVREAIELGPEGFVGDHQADRRVHGGPDKAVHLYPSGHYRRLAAAFPDAAPALVPGSLGENLSADLEEAGVCLGDVFRLGTARLQVSQPRSPCWKIDDRFGADGMAAHIAETGLTGWYWRVLEGGRVSPGDHLALESRVAAAIPLARAMAIWRTHRPALADLEAIAAAPGIAAGWRQKLLDRAVWLRKQPDTPPPAPPLVHARRDD